MFIKKANDTSIKHYSTKKCFYPRKANMTEKSQEVYASLKAHPPIIQNLETGQETIEYYEKHNMSVDPEVYANYNKDNDKHYVYDSNFTHKEYSSKYHTSTTLPDKTAVTTTNKLGFLTEESWAKFMT